MRLSMEFNVMVIKVTLKLLGDKNICGLTTDSFKNKSKWFIPS